MEIMMKFLDRQTLEAISKDKKGLIQTVRKR